MFNNDSDTLVPTKDVNAGQAKGWKLDLTTYGT